jgi:hypothetical protein
MNPQRFNDLMEGDVDAVSLWAGIDFEIGDEIPTGVKFLACNPDAVRAIRTWKSKGLVATYDKPDYTDSYRDEDGERVQTWHMQITLRGDQGTCQALRQWLSGPDAPGDLFIDEDDQHLDVVDVADLDLPD